MTVKWKRKKKLSPKIILEELEKAKLENTENSKPNVLSYNGDSFDGFGPSAAFTALRICLDYPDRIGDAKMLSFIRKAAANAGLKGSINEATFLENLVSIIAKELTRRNNKFHLLTSINISGFPYRNRGINGAKIRFFEDEFPKKYIDRVLILEKMDAGSRKNSEPSSYKKVIITVDDVDEYSAAVKCLDIIDLQRSIFCILKNPSWAWRSDDWSPINTIRLGNCHSIHLSNGRLASINHWYEPNFSLATNSIDLGSKTIIQNNDWVLSRLSKCKYSDKLKKAMLQYVRALDERDQNVALIKLWSALETLCGVEYGKSDSIVKRCSFLFQNSELHKQMLEYLRDTRNRSVHSGDPSSNALDNCYQLTTYFKALLKFHLNRVDSFSSITEANRFLDLPTDPVLLGNTLEIFQNAIKYRSSSE